MVGDLKDMILELGDLGFYTYVDTNSGIIEVTISKVSPFRPNEFFKNEEELGIMKDVLRRINDYAKSCHHLVDSTWLARLTNLSEEDLKKSLNDNKGTMYITMYPKHR